MATEDKLGQLFDIIPGLELCTLSQRDPRGDRVYGSVLYSNPNSAAYALEKLHGFDYPSGSRIMIKFDESGPKRMGIGGRGVAGGSGVVGGAGAGGAGGGASGSGETGGNLPEEIKTLVNTIKHATQMLNQAGYGDAISVSGGQGGGFNETMFSGSLPPAQPILQSSTPCVERLFVVFINDCRGDLPSQHILVDVFSRFGSLIDVYMLKGKKCGYVKYGTRESAQKAIETLHEKILCGSFMKVMIAEDGYAEKNKRARVDN